MKINASEMLEAATDASELLKALANRHRLLIVCQLVDGERSVGELADFLGIRDSTVSQHLALLRKDGIVAARREAQTIYYAISSAAAQRILQSLYDIYCMPSRANASSARASPTRATAKPKRKTRVSP